MSATGARTRDLALSLTLLQTFVPVFVVLQRPALEAEEPEAVAVRVDLRRSSRRRLVPSRAANVERQLLAGQNFCLCIDLGASCIDLCP